MTIVLNQQDVEKCIKTWVEGTFGVLTGEVILRNPYSSNNLYAPVEAHVSLKDEEK